MVDAINGPSAATVSTPNSMRTRLQDVTAAVAKELGMSTDDLTQALRSGQSMDQIAQSKGVSHDDLVATISQALQSSATTGQSTDPDQIKALAERIAGAKGHHHHHHHRADGVDAGGAQATTTGTATSGDATAPTAPTADPGAVGFRVDTRA